MKPVVLRPAAIADLERARDWYRQETPGLGEELRVDLQQVLSLIAENPRLFPRVYKSVHRALTKRFPYKIFYRVRGDLIEVLAIRHQSRKPLPGVER